MFDFALSHAKYGVANLVSVTIFLVTGAAHADPKACITTHATGQREAKAGHLRLATQLFTQCGSDESCPNQLRQECAEYLQTVQLTVPTVIFSVLDEHGNDISNAKVYSTDELVAESLDGRALQIDPGKHRLRFLLPWGAVLSSDVLIREGEKNRLIQVRMGANGSDAAEISSKPAGSQPASTASTQSTAPAAPAPASEARKIPTAAWILAGTSVASLGVGTTFAIMGRSKKSDIDACSPNCGSNVHATYDALKRDYLIADIGFAVAAVSAGFATWLFVAPPSKHVVDASASNKGLSLTLHPVGFALPGGGALGVYGGF